MKARVLSLRFTIFALVPATILLLAAETAVRLKYFFAHQHDWHYLTTPLGGDIAGPDRWKSPKDQMVVTWRKPCVDSTVFSPELQRQAPRTFDENCFRGDHVKPQKSPDEYRIVFLGGSTVEDAQSDSEIMTERFKEALPPAYQEKRTTVVNAGKPGFQSRLILLYWQSWVHSFAPDLVLYYEGWNEIPTDVKWTRVDQRLAGAGDRFHKALYYRSLLYTYLVEKSAFLTASDEHFWKIEVNDLRRNFVQLATEVRERRARFIFVTQVIHFPRIWKGVDTFDRRAVEALLDRMKADPQYAYDMKEVSALNQRLAIDTTVDICREQHVPVIDIRESIEALGEAQRAELFMDLGHLTVKGDRIVGGLIGHALGALN